LWTPAEVEEELKKFDEKISNVDDMNTENIPVAQLKIDKGVFLKNKAKDWDRAEEVLRDALKTAGGANKKLEVYFEIMQMTLDKLEVKSIKKDIETCKELVEDGGDWEKKNKLKVYEGLYLIMIRDYLGASQLFLDSVATFTCENLLSFKKFAFLTVVTSLVSQGREALKSRVIHNPEILAVVRDIPNLRDYMESYYRCDYKEFFRVFCEIADTLKKEPLFAFSKNHLHYVKEMRLSAYKQFLESYKSVTIVSMAESFGVSCEFIDRELSHFISIRKLNCVIDKVGGIIESKKGQKNMEEYKKLVKIGDQLLNRMQKLGRALDM